MEIVMFRHFSWLAMGDDDYYYYYDDDNDVDDLIFILTLTVMRYLLIAALDP